MKITKRQLRRIIKEASEPQEAPATEEEAYQLGLSRGSAGRPDVVHASIKAWLANGIAKEVVEAYLHGYKVGQIELDFMYSYDDDDGDDESDWYSGKEADDMADKFGLEQQSSRMRRRAQPQGRQPKTTGDASGSAHPPEAGHGSVPERYLDHYLRLTKNQLGYIIKESVRKYKR